MLADSRVPSGVSIRQPRYVLHARIRAAAVGVTIFLVLLEALLARKIPEQRYSGLVLNNLLVERVSPGSPSEIAGFRKGDRITSVSGVPCTSLRDVSQCLSRVDPGDVVLYVVKRGETAVTLPLTFARAPFPEVLRKALLIFVGLSFVAIGLVVYFKRADKLALLFYLLCLAFGLVLLNVVNFEISSARHAYKAAFYDLVVLALPALFLHFFLIFPERSPLVDRRPQMEYLIYAPAAALFPVSEFFNVMIFSFGRSYTRAIGLFQTVTACYFIAFIVLGLAGFMRSYMRVVDSGLRKKLRLVLWGTLAGVLPLIFVRIVLSIGPSVEIPGERFSFLPLLLVPIAFGHAIVRYGLMDLEIVIKRSVVYAVLTAVLASIYFTVVYGAGRLASRFVGSADLLFSLLSIFFISLLISPLRKRIGISVDRLFFREEYNYRRVLRQISHSLAGLVDLDRLLGYVAERTGEILHCSAVAVYVFDEKTGAFIPRQALGCSPGQCGSFPKDGPLVRFLETHGQTLNVERRVAANRPVPVSDGEAETLGSIHSSLIVPFMFQSVLLGFISIGRKMSGGYYASADVELLETLCDQASVAIENARLYLDNLEKQKMDHELDVAREIQRRLLPKAFPEIAGLKTHGMNVPSECVGGDYYDVIPLSPAKVAVIIADVSGKGVPAALLMASLQSTLRAEADLDKLPSEVISALNETIYEHTSGETFVTIFYGIIDFERESLTYCSAGQTPPFIIRGDLSFDRLDHTDLVLGIESHTEFTNTTLRLNPGDLLFLYTDGITDEFNEHDDPYGEARLVRDLRALYGQDLQAIVEKVYDAVVRHTKGKPQDDLTTLAIRIERLRAPISPTPTTEKLLNLSGSNPD